MLISNVAARLGVRTDTVRYYAREGLLKDRHISRRPNGYRDYGEPAVERLSLLLQARRSGLSIAEIKTLATAFDDGALTLDLQLQLLRDKLARLDHQARELRVTRNAIARKITDLESRQTNQHLLGDTT